MNKFKIAYLAVKKLEGVYSNDATDNGVDTMWHEGMLDDDNLHPSELGAIRLAMEALRVCPELYNQ